MSRNYPRPKGPSAEPRDRWLYEQCVAGVPYPRIVAALKANAHGGKPIASKQGVYGAALRYAERHGVPRPGSARQRTCTRQRGRTATPGTHTDDRRATGNKSRVRVWCPG